MTETASETRKGERILEECLAGLVFEQTEESFGWLVDLIGIFLDEFPDTTVHRLRVKVGVRLFDLLSQVGPAQTLGMLIEQLEGRRVYPLCDFRRLDIG